MASGALPPSRGSDFHSGKDLQRTPLHLSLTTPRGSTTASGNFLTAIDYELMPAKSTRGAKPDERFRFFRIPVKGHIETISVSLSLVCPICLEPFRKPRRFDPCAHVLCSECYFASATLWCRDKCPICRGSIAMSFICDALERSLYKTLRQPLPECHPGDIVRILEPRGLSSESLYMLAGTIIDICDGLISDDFVTVIDVHQISKMNIEEKQVLSGLRRIKIARVKAYDRVWIGRISEIEPLDPSYYSLGTRCIPGSVLIRPRVSAMSDIAADHKLIIHSGESSIQSSEGSDNSVPATRCSPEALVDGFFPLSALHDEVHSFSVVIQDSLSRVFDTFAKTTDSSGHCGHPVSLYLPQLPKYAPLDLIFRDNLIYNSIRLRRAEGLSGFLWHNAVARSILLFRHEAKRVPVGEHLSPDAALPCNAGEDDFCPSDEEATGSIILPKPHELSAAYKKDIIFLVSDLLSLPKQVTSKSDGAFQADLPLTSGSAETDDPISDCPPDSDGDCLLRKKVDEPRVSLRSNTIVDNRNKIISDSDGFSEAEKGLEVLRPDSSNMNSNIALASKSAPASSPPLRGYLRLISDLSLFIIYPSFSCHGCKGILRFPVKASCGHFYCFNCLMDCIENAWRCFCCGNRLTSDTFECDASYSTVRLPHMTSTFVFSHVLPRVDWKMVERLQRELPWHHCLLDIGFPCTLKGDAFNNLGIIMQNPLLGHVTIIFGDRTVARVPCDAVSCVNPFMLRPALRFDTGLSVSFMSRTILSFGIMHEERGSIYNDGTLFICNRYAPVIHSVGTDMPDTCFRNLRLTRDLVPLLDAARAEGRQQSIRHLQFRMHVYRLELLDKLDSNRRYLREQNIAIAGLQRSIEGVTRQSDTRLQGASAKSAEPAPGDAYPRSRSTRVLPHDALFGASSNPHTAYPMNDWYQRSVHRVQGNTTTSTYGSRLRSCSATTSQRWQTSRSTLHPVQGSSESTTFDLVVTATMHNYKPRQGFTELPFVSRPRSTPRPPPFGAYTSTHNVLDATFKHELLRRDEDIILRKKYTLRKELGLITQGDGSLPSWPIFPCRSTSSSPRDAHRSILEPYADNLKKFSLYVRSGRPAISTLKEFRDTRFTRHQKDEDIDRTLVRSLCDVARTYPDLDFLCKACHRVLRRPLLLACGDIVCRTCACMHIAGNIPCLACGSTVSDVSTLTLQKELQSAILFCASRVFPNLLMDIGSFVRCRGNENIGILLGFVYSQGVHCAHVSFFGLTRICRLQDLEILEPLWDDIDLKEFRVHSEEVRASRSSRRRHITRSRRFRSCSGITTNDTAAITYEQGALGDALFAVAHDLSEYQPHNDFDSPMDSRNQPLHVPCESTKTLTTPEQPLDEEASYTAKNKLKPIGMQLSASTTHIPDRSHENSPLDVPFSSYSLPPLREKMDSDPERSSFDEYSGNIAPNSSFQASSEISTSHRLMRSDTAHQDHGQPCSPILGDSVANHVARPSLNSSTENSDSNISAACQEFSTHNDPALQIVHTQSLPCVPAGPSSVGTTVEQKPAPSEIANTEDAPRMYVPGTRVTKLRPVYYEFKDCSKSHFVSKKTACNHVPQDQVGGRTSCTGSSYVQPLLEDTRPYYPLLAEPFIVLYGSYAGMLGIVLGYSRGYKNSKLTYNVVLETATCHHFQAEHLHRIELVLGEDAEAIRQRVKDASDRFTRQGNEVLRTLVEQQVRSEMREKSIAQNAKAVYTPPVYDNSALLMFKSFLPSFLKTPSLLRMPP